MNGTFTGSNWGECVKGASTGLRQPGRAEAASWGHHQDAYRARGSAGPWETAAAELEGGSQHSETWQGGSQGINYPDFTSTPSNSCSCLPLTRPNWSQRGRKPFQATRPASGNTSMVGKGGEQIWRGVHGKHPDIVCHLCSVFLSQTPPEFETILHKRGELVGLILCGIPELGAAGT